MLNYLLIYTLFTLFTTLLFSSINTKNYAKKFVKKFVLLFVFCAALSTCCCYYSSSNIQYNYCYTLNLKIMQNTKKSTAAQSAKNSAKNVITRTLKNNKVVKYYSVNNKANNFNVVNSKASNKTHLQKLNTAQQASYNTYFNTVLKNANITKQNFNITVKSYVNIQVACKTVKHINLQHYCSANKFFIYMQIVQQQQKNLLNFVLKNTAFNVANNNVCIKHNAVYIYNITVAQHVQVVNLIKALAKF